MLTFVLFFRNNISMAKQTSFAHQKEVLEQFSTLLSEMESDLKALVYKYEKEMLSLYEDQGLMEEIYEDYKITYLNPLSNSLLELTTRIQEEDIPFIEKEIDFIASR
ncbi:hypothetical protein FACS1894160_4040 [Bacteroidia bacterium]|nr:hypothetical protein FACS1894123_00730 [Bacteroidia bacterium]GHV08933.1 hypothetical protein FACS1894160_4040 [Bacteroidia bacterium]